MGDFEGHCVHLNQENSTNKKETLFSYYACEIFTIIEAAGYFYVEKTNRNNVA